MIFGKVVKVDTSALNNARIDLCMRCLVLGSIAGDAQLEVVMRSILCSPFITGVMGGDSMTSGLLNVAWTPFQHFMALLCSPEGKLRSFVLSPSILWSLPPSPMSLQKCLGELIQVDSCSPHNFP